MFLFLDVGKHDGKPFYFGTTDVACMRMIRTRRKRSLNATASLPNRKFWSLTHRWIYYDGWYFELFYEPHTRRAAKTEKCPSHREANPAGYTQLDIECVRRCADYYNERFTKQYNALTHNCHHYANKLAELMCINSSCPDWCTTIYLWRWWLKGDRQEMPKPSDKSCNNIKIYKLLYSCTLMEWHNFLSIEFENKNSHHSILNVMFISSFM